jgi:hypothetical protein
MFGARENKNMKWNLELQSLVNINYISSASDGLLLRKHLSV